MPPVAKITILSFEEAGAASVVLVVALRDGDEEGALGEEEGAGEASWLMCEEAESAGGRSGGVVGGEREEDGDEEEGLLRSGRRMRGWDLEEVS